MSDYPRIIEELREATGWKVDLIAEFLGVTRSTVYNWWHGDTTPAAEFRAVLTVFLDDVLARRSVLSRIEYQKWLTRTFEEGVDAYIERLGRRDPGGTPKNLVERAREGNGLLIETQDQEPVTYVVPFTAGALQVLIRALIVGFGNGERRREEEESRPAQVGVPSSTA